MKFEILVRCPKCGNDLPESAFGVCRARPSGRNLYCKVCIIQKVSGQRDLIRAMKQAQASHREAGSLPERELAPRRKQLTLTDRVKLAIQRGCKTRDEIETEIQKTTKVSWDNLSDALAGLAFETQELRIVRKGETREFHLAA